MRLFETCILIAALTPLFAWEGHGQSVSEYEKRAVENVRAKKGNAKTTVKSYEKAALAKSEDQRRNDEKLKNIFKSYFGNFMVDCGDSAFITNGNLIEVKALNADSRAIDILYGLLGSNVRIVSPTIEQKLNNPNAHDMMLVSYYIRDNYKSAKFKDALFFRNLGNGDKSWKRFIDPNSYRDGIEMGVVQLSLVNNSYSVENISPPSLNIEYSVYGDSDESELREKLVKGWLLKNKSAPISGDFCKNPEKADQQILRHLGSISKFGALLRLNPVADSLARRAELEDCSENRSKFNSGSYDYRDIYSIGIRLVLPGGAADKFGLQVGDMIVAVDGKAISESTDFSSLVNSLPAKSPLKLTLVTKCRPGSSDWTQRTVNIVLGGG